MTTLTSSPSPASSPRLSFRHSSPRAQFATASHRSPTAARSPRPSYSNSPRRAFNAPADSSPRPQQQSQRQQQRPIDGGAVTGGGAGYVYADAGTQYSPEGFPPTAGRKVAILHAVGQPPRSTTASSSGSAGASARKRKEATPPDSSPHQPMRVSSASSGAHRRPAQQAPAEPSVRADPTPPADSTSTASAAESEPQEARSTHGHSAAPKRSRADPACSKVMPLKYETCNPKDLGVLVANMLMELIRINDKIPLRDGRLTRFHSRAPPGISVTDYLQRLIQHATLSPPIMLSMVYYIDRLCTLYPAFTINSLTVHRFLITAATVAAKGLSDSFWTNPTYARIGGIPVSELATLELELLQRVEWKIVPKPEVLEDYYSSLVDRTEGYTMEPTGSGSDSSSLHGSSSSSKTGPPKEQDEEMADDAT